MKTKTVKLTDRQQEVVNLLGEGWTLEYYVAVEWWSSCDLVSPGAEERRKMKSNMARALQAKGVVASTPNGFRSSTFRLTELGRSLVKSTKA